MNQPYSQRGSGATPPQKERKPLAVEILNYYPLEGNALRGLFDVVIGRGQTTLKIYGMRYIKQGAQKAFCAGPQKTIQDCEGKRQYFPVVSLPRLWCDDVLAALEEYLRNQNGRLFSEGHQ